ncbi:hypothetical protein [Brevibacillus marinus]|uniref:hypothetical protein n=1 Tax=Brevibacillus marinus TaxID=2496837 RepID=UPI000F82007D|nr:hypothetical protein [Brevibacillus marinus]
MELSKLAPVEIWRLLIPARMQLFADELSGDELIFRYRDKVYFVHEDGAVLALPTPPQLKHMTFPAFLEYLMKEDETIDFDENGVFDIGSILRQIGFVVSCGRRRERADYTVEIIDALAPGQPLARYVLCGVSFTFALFHGLLCCSYLHELAEEDGEFEVKRITRCSFHHSDSEKQHKIVYDDTCT